MDDKIYASIRMTDSITQQVTSFDQVRFTNATSTTNRRRSRFNLRLVMLVPAVVIGLLPLLACQQAGY